MSDKDIHAKLDELLSANPDIIPSERIINLQDLGDCLPKSFVPGLENKLYNVLKVYLHSKNFDLQKCALNLLHTCLENQNLTTLPDALSLNLAYAVIFICNNSKDNSPEYQELWLKAFDTLQVMSELYPILSQNHGIRLLSVFQKALSVTYTSTVQKLKALNMLDKYISTVDIQNVKEMLYHLCSEQLLPLAFGKDNENIQSLCLQVAYRLLPGIKQVLIKYPEEWEKIFGDIRRKYVPAIDRLISENNCTFAKLWIFLIKLIGSKFHKGSPVVNSLLSCIEAAFKVPNLEVRKQSFFCWQVLIEGFTIEPNEAYTEKRIKLLIIPLKTNNGKTEDLVKVKIVVWCKLLEVLNKYNIIGSYDVLNAYLNFCFGPLGDIPLMYHKDSAHGLISQGKKYPSVHLTTCKSLLQLIGNPLYIDEELERKLNVFNFKGPAVNTLDFIKFSQNIIYSVGESCIMLSQLENSNRFECNAINEALWKSLFFTIDSLDIKVEKINAIKKMSDIILALINVARRKPYLINFGLKALFNIITSTNFGFCQEEQFANELFIPMIGVVIKRDKILLHEDVITILKSVFTFKRNSENYLQFIEKAKNLLVEENFVNAEKVILLRSVWYIIEEELLNFDKKDVDEKLYFNIFYEFLNWPLATSSKAKSSETIDLKWRELYSFFCKTTSALSQYKLSNMLIRNICDLEKEAPNNITNAEYTYYIISDLKLDNCDDETCEEITQIYSTIKTIVSVPTLSPEIVNIYESCVSHMLDTNFNFPKLHCLLPSINGCLASLLEIYSKTDILRSATLFLEKVDKSDDKLKPEIENLRQIVEKHKHTMDNKMSSVEVDAKIDKCEKEQTLILLGHDIKTMTPVKLKGSMLKAIGEKQSPSTTEKSPKNKNDTKDAANVNSELVFVNSPYKFDPKKLTKQQKERLSRRRDDIPALYQDLTQSSSQLNDLNTSNSESLLEQIKPQMEQKQQEQLMKTKESTTTTITNIIDNNKTDSNKEHEDNLNKELNESSHSDDIIQSDSQPMEQNTRVKRQRKSFNFTRSKQEAEPNVTEKRVRGRKRKNSNDTVNMTSPNGISKENVDLNKIRAEPEDIVKVTRRRRSAKSQMKNVAETIESVIENESSSSDTISSTQESTANVANNLPIKLKITTKNKRKTKNVPSPVNVEAEKNGNTETTTETDDSKEIADSETPSMIDDEKPLINLEANTELNKLEGVPIYLGRPAKILRGTRRVSEGGSNNIAKKPNAEKNIIDYANLFVSKNANIDDEKAKKKMLRELKNMRIDIKNSEEYLKKNGRKTRQQTEVQRTRRGRLINRPCKPDEYQLSELSSEESDFIESSQENERSMNIKQCEVRALYSLEKITSGVLLKEPESSNRPKISPIKINIKSNKLVKNVSPKTKTENSEEKSTSSENDKTPDIINNVTESSEDKDETLIKDKLDSQDVTIATETESLPSQLNQSDNAASEDICEKRRVILSNSLTSTEEETPSTPPKLLNANNLPTSPVSNDTPTRNKELLEDTLEISPIKKVPNKANVDDVPAASVTEAENPPEENESPILFESETVNTASPKTDDTEKVFGNSSQYSNRMLRKSKSRVLSGRSAKMMKMISAKQTFVPATSAKASTVNNKVDAYCSPSSNRTKKMMNNLEKCDVAQDMETATTSSNQTSTSSEPLINQDDVLCIGKELPSPFALPSGSILKRKRNGPEETTEESIVPVIKKRRVNFSDPPVSCMKFIEKIIKPASCFSKHLPKELRTTRASTAEELEIENEINADQESQSLLDIVPIEDVEVPENSTDVIITAKVYDNTKPICETLLDNEEPISKIIAKLTNSLDFVEPVTTVLENKNVDTIGDLAKLTESQVHTIPLKVETVKTVLKEYYESLKQETPTKEKRKITPVILSSPEKIAEPHSTCEVSVIMENKDMISEIQSANPTTEKEPESYEVSNNEFSEKLFSGDSEKIEQATINKIKTVAVVSSPETLFNSPVNRMTLKTEFDSPTNAKDNILNEEYCNIRVVKFIQFIRNLFVQKKYDPRPIISALFANNTEILTQMNCWEDLIKYIVRDIGIWKLTKYLCSLKNIPALMIESILKNSLNEIGNDFICERLNKHEIMKFLSKECNLINLLQEYDAQTVYSTFFDLANDTQYSQLKYKEMLQELYACVFQPQIEICHLLYKLDVDSIEEAVVKRMSTPNDMDTFLEKICKSVSLEVYLKPTKQQTKVDGTNETSTEEKQKSSELVANVVRCVDNNQLSKDEELMILRSIAKKWNALEFFQTFSEHTKQN